MTIHKFKEYTPEEYLMIDMANNYGLSHVTKNGLTTYVDLDKTSFENRIAWVEDLRDKDHLTHYINTAEKPALFFAGLQAYNETLKNNPIGYPVSLDACSSGLQILAVMSNCEKSAKRCGIVNTGKREDAYTSLFEDMQKASSTELRASRSDMKQAIMTSLYGSKAQPRILFGKGTPELDLFYEIMEEEIPGAWKLNLALKDLWQPYADKHSWTLPDGFEVCMAVEAVETDEVSFLGEPVKIYTNQYKGAPSGRSLSPNIVHSIDGMVVREMTRRCSFRKKQKEKLLSICEVSIKRKTRRASTTGKGRSKDKLLKSLWKKYISTGFLSSRVLSLIDESNVGIVSAFKVKELISTLPNKSFPILAIHDCFRVHPNYGNDLRMQYNYIMSDLAKSDLLGDIATQITGKKKTLSKLGDISSKILDANYALS